MRIRNDPEEDAHVAPPVERPEKDDLERDFSSFRRFDQLTGDVLSTREVQIT